MDLSKLPRLSKTNSPAAAPESGGAGASPPPAGFEPVIATPVAAAGYCQCGAPLRGGARFCDSCGTPVAGAAAAPPQPEFYIPRDAGVGAETWISIAVGAILILMSPRIWQYFLMPGSFTWTFTDSDGNPLPYRQTVFFWGDLALAAFSVTLILEGIAMAFRHRRLVMVALTVTVLATVLNLVYVVAMMAKGFGFQILSGLAVAFGVYIAIFQWKALEFRGPHTRRG